MNKLKSRSNEILIAAMAYAGVIWASTWGPWKNLGPAAAPVDLLLVPFIIGLTARTILNFSLADVMLTLTPLALLAAYLIATVGAAIAQYAIPFVAAAGLSAAAGHAFSGLVNRATNRKIENGK